MQPLREIIEQARNELDREEHRAAVDRMKQHMRDEAGRPWWRRVFPWKITIERR